MKKGDEGGREEISHYFSSFKTIKEGGGNGGMEGWREGGIWEKMRGDERE